MSWFDAAGLTSLAKSALKEAQRTIDKALDIEENDENIQPPITPSATTPKGLPEKLKDESEDFFASFGLDKKSPLTPANSPSDFSPGAASPSKDDGKSSSSAIMVGSLWGSFTGSFFENPSATKQKNNDSCEVSNGTEKSIVATQPPRRGTCLPTLQLTTSPVSTQPRTANLEDHSDSKGCQVEKDQTIKGQHLEDINSIVDGTTNEWGWGWESSIMVMARDQQHLEGDFGTTPAELEAREDILADDAIDVEGFAKSRLVVGSVDSDSGGFVQQESQGSLSGRSVDLDVPSVISEDVFYGEQEDKDNLKVKRESQGSEQQCCQESRRNSIDLSCKVEVCERRTTVSYANSEVNTPDSIVVLTSDSSSPDGDMSGSLPSVAGKKLTVDFVPEKVTSPISSPESIEVLGSSSLVTSPSSIEVLSGLSSSDSSPTHQDSCSNTLIQDLSPPSNVVVSMQPTIQPSVTSDIQPYLQQISDQHITSQEMIPEDADASQDDKKTATHTSAGALDGASGEEAEGTIPAVSLDISVESGGSSDTITASVDSSQMVWSATRLNEYEQQGGSEMQESKMTCSGGSVVRCLLEEAIGDEEAASEASSPPEREHSPSSSERSEALKVGSGHTSGHSSGDEVETTTSSDIEVISSPSLDGSTIVRGSATASRVWASAQRGLRSLLNDRSESPASDSSSNNKKTNNDKGHRRNQSNFSETSESSSENHSSEMDKLLKKVSQLTEVLEARETKVMELSQVNAALQDTNLRLKGHIEELEGGNGIEATESLREEYTQRLVTMERKFQQALREKEAIKKQLEEVRAEAATRLSSAEVARDQEERDTVIRELREEGEKLSKQQLNYSNIIKKLRSKEKENETTIKTQKDKLEEQSRELERLRKQLSAKEEMERRQIDAVCQLNTTNQRLEQMVKDANAENAELEGKMTALKSALDTAYREMTELQRTAATKDAEAQEQALSAEVGARKQLEAALAEVQAQGQREQEALVAQVLELQDALSRSENQANRKERQLRLDISELQQRVSEAEARAEELSGAVSAATKPLLRQMENLQSTHSSQQATWETLESTLTHRLNEAQMAAAASSERERATREQYADLAANSAVLQTQVANLHAENTKLTSQLDLLTTKMESLTEIRTKEATQIEALKASFAEEIADVKRERDSLEQQLEIEKIAVAAEKKKTVALQDQLKDRERKLLQLTSTTAESQNSTPRSSPTPSLSRLSVSGSLTESFSGSQWGDEVFEASWSRGTSLYESMRGNTTSTVDALTSQLQQREGELHHLQSEVTRYEAQRESLAQELVAITSQMEYLQVQLQDHQVLQEQYADMEQKYNALLQMHGEKVEEVEELRLDLADVKEMYKAQIDQLLQK